MVIRYLFFLALILLAKYSFAQVEPDYLSDTAQKKILKKVENISNIEEKFKTVENLIASKKITNKECLADLYCERAYTYWVKYESDSLDLYNYLNGDKTGSTIIKHILDDLRLAVKTYPLNEPKYRHDRLDFLEAFNEDHPLVEQDKVYLKQHGYKEDVFGLSPAVNYIYGKNSWLGVELSAFEALTRSFVLKNKDTLDGKMKKVNTRGFPFAMEILTIGYNQSLVNSAHEFTISGIRFTAPVYIEVTKFGFERGLNATHGLWFYRPEIGIGNSFISIGYAYNLMFNKSVRNNWEKSLFVIKLSYPIIKYK
jgi:hypothetical protein